MGGPAVSFSEQLRTETADLRAAAERHRFQRALLGGDIGREAWIAYLRALLALHAAIEGALRRCPDGQAPALAAVISPRNRRAAAIRADLRALGAGPGRAGSAARTGAAAIRRRAEKQPASLLGCHYVLEGTTNGNHFIAPAVRRALNLTGEAGVSAFDPYGEDQPREWERYRAALDGAALSAAQRAEAVAAARGVFDAVQRVMDELWPGRPGPAGGYPPARSGSGKSRQSPD